MQDITQFHRFTGAPQHLCRERPERLHRGAYRRSWLFRDRFGDQIGAPGSAFWEPTATFDDRCPFCSSLSRGICSSVVISVGPTMEGS